MRWIYSELALTQTNVNFLNYTNKMLKEYKLTADRKHGYSNHKPQELPEILHVTQAT
jgi:hypothetical protein